MKTCPNCGEKISNESSKFCSNCGVELEITSSNLKNVSNNNADKLVGSASNALNQVVAQAKIEKNYIKYRLDDNNETPLKGDEFIISEKIANTIENINTEKQYQKPENTKKTEIKVEEEPKKK